MITQASVTKPEIQKIGASNKKRMYHAAYILTCMLSIGVFAKAFYIDAKALMAQHLMAIAWEKGREEKRAQKPWPWADGKVIAKMHYQGHTHFILSQQSDRNMAFAPSLMTQSDGFKQSGHSVLSAHKDTHFAYLKDIQFGDVIEVEYIGGKRRYRIVDYGVVSAFDYSIIREKPKVSEQGKGSQAMLTLITCFPFDYLYSQPSLRFAARAIEIRN